MNFPRLAQGARAKHARVGGGRGGPSPAPNNRHSLSSTGFLPRQGVSEANEGGRGRGRKPTPHLPPLSYSFPRPPHYHHKSRAAVIFSLLSKPRHHQGSAPTGARGGWGWWRAQPRAELRPHPPTSSSNPIFTPRTPLPCPAISTSTLTRRECKSASLPPPHNPSPSHRTRDTPPAGFLPRPGGAQDSPPLLFLHSPFTIPPSATTPKTILRGHLLFLFPRHRPGGRHDSAAGWAGGGGGPSPAPRAEPRPHPPTSPSNPIFTPRTPLPCPTISTSTLTGRECKSASLPPAGFLPSPSHTHHQPTAPTARILPAPRHHPQRANPRLFAPPPPPHPPPAHRTRHLHHLIDGNRPSTRQTLCFGQHSPP